MLNNSTKEMRLGLIATFPCHRPVGTGSSVMRFFRCSEDYLDCGISALQGPLELEVNFRDKKVIVYKPNLEAQLFSFMKYCANMGDFKVETRYN